MPEQHILILAGEASGDAHAAEFVSHLKHLNPELKCSGMGGKAMREAGVEVFYDSSAIAVVGLIEVLKHWGEIKRAMAIVRQQLDTQKPDLLVLVDYPEFNLKMAAHARSLGIPVLFYISPQVWAWRPKRIHKIGRLIDHMAVLFRFEKKYYENAGIPVTFVGHPLVDKVQSKAGKSECRDQLGIDVDSQVIGLFPGSRQSEINRLLPLMLETAERLQKEDSSRCFLLPVASTLDKTDIETRCGQSIANILISDDPLYEVITACDAIISCSGTVTLEIALLETPLCIVYRMSWLTHQIMSRLITIPRIGLANIVADQPIVREFLQNEATAENLQRETNRLLADENYRQTMKQNLKLVRKNLGDGHGAENIARLILKLLKGDRSL